MKYSEQFRVEPGNEVRLNKINPDYTAEHTKKKSAVKLFLWLEPLDHWVCTVSFCIPPELT